MCSNFQQMLDRHKNILAIILLSCVSYILTSYFRGNVENVYGKAFELNNIDQSKQRFNTENISLAFFLQIYDKNVGHAPRLLEKIWEMENVYAIHVDAKVDDGKYFNFQEYIYGENISYKTNVFL